MQVDLRRWDRAGGGGRTRAAQVQVFQDHLPALRSSRQSCAGGSAGSEGGKD